ncbi:hypothetical protein EDD53_0031 [Pacificibacter maritimus]|uniref:Uncharacterized protein n=1 Tax=Pacificibacter maritimus TaxID=762213 RepID=A0A3N4UTP6_9RHOB|nr:hypothetical protein EDD53_0031 [Pacificibacter maritimus]
MILIALKYEVSTLCLWAYFALNPDSRKQGLPFAHSLKVIILNLNERTCRGLMPLL